MTPARKYDATVGEEILVRLAQGETLRGICRGEGMPAASTVCYWVTENLDGFGERYRRARDIGLDLMAEETLEIADDSTNDWVERQREDGSEFMMADREHIARARLRVDTRKWFLSKMAPKKYGERVQLDG